MLTINFYLQDRLIKGQLGIIKHTLLNSRNNVSRIYLKFDYCKAGLKKMNTDSFARQHLCVPIEEATDNIRIKLSKN